MLMLLEDVSIGVFKAFLPLDKLVALVKEGDLIDFDALLAGEADTLTSEP